MKLVGHMTRCHGNLASTWYACKQDISKTINARDMEQKAN